MPRAVVVAPVNVSCPVMVVEALIVVEAPEIKPFEKVWRLLQVFVVVVLNAKPSAPVEGL